MIPPPPSPTEVAVPPPNPTKVAAPPSEVASAPASEASAISGAASPEGEAATGRKAAIQPLAASNNSYKLILIEGEPESRPPDEHAD